MEEQQVFVQVNQRNKHWVWNIHRPDRANALGTTIATELAEELASLKKLLSKDAEKIRSLTISATPLSKPSGAPVWIAGGDLKELASLKNKKAARAYAATLSQLCFDLEKLPIPVIVAIDGAAIGGGAELALAGDVRFATVRSTFIFKQLDVGLATGYGGAHRLVNLIGKCWSQNLLYLGNSVNAEQALGMGLLHGVYSDAASLEDGIRSFTARVEALDPKAFATQKLMINQAGDHSRLSAKSSELALFEKLWRNPAHEKFLEKFGK
jgi:enoyl-CoA hydratase/carnithine racemase